MFILAGIIVLLIVSAIIVGLIAWSVRMVQLDTRREERAEARHLARIWATEDYNRMVQNTRFRVRQALVFSNESDIEW